MERHGTRMALGLALALGIVLTACSSGTDPATSADASEAAPAGAAWNVITPAQLDDMMANEEVYLVNVHVPFDGAIPGTDAFIPYTDIVNELDRLPFGKESVVIYCRSGSMSTEAAQAMVAAGAPAFSELGGGFYAWQDAGYQLQLDPPEGQ